MLRIAMKIALGTGIILIALYFAFRIYKHQSESLPVKAVLYNAPKASGASWEEVLNHPVSVDLELLDTGSLVVAKSEILNFKHPDAKELTDGDKELTVFSYLIHHKKLGHYLVDTGLGSSIQRSPHGELKGILVKKMLKGFTQEKGKDIAAQLQERGVVPRGIFLTHLHYDHVAGLPDLPASVPCYVAKDEHYSNYKFLYENHSLNGFNNINQFDFTKASIMEPLGPAIDVFGDGSFWAISTPGHTPGHVSYLINSTSGVLLIAGDACPTRYGLESGIGPGTFSTNIELAQATFDRIMEFKRAYPQVKILPSHELP